MREPQANDLRRVIGGLWRRLPLIVLFAVLASAAGLVASLVQTEQYTAKASLLFRDPGFDERLFGTPVLGVSDPNREAATNLELVSLDAVAERTADDIGGDITPAQVSEKVEIEEAGQADVVAVSATDSSPEFAATLANSFAESYIAFRRQADRAAIAEAQRLIELDLEALDSAGGPNSQERSLQDQLSQLRTLEALQTGNAELVQEAGLPTSPSSPKTLRNTVLGGLLGLLLGIGTALLVERLDRRLRDPDELEDAFGLPVLTHVPQSDSLASGSAVEGLGTREAEAFRMLRTRLRYFNVDRDLGSILFTSPGPGEGKSTLALQAARTAAGAGRKTILVEADFHQPVVAERAGLAPIPGLSELITHQGSLEDAIQSVPANRASNRDSVDRYLDVIVAGALPPNPAELLGSDEISALLKNLEQAYDLIVVDTPPVTIMSDAIPLMSMVDGVVVVARIGTSRRDAADDLRDQLERLDAPALGVVVNGAKGGHGYGYYYGDQRTPSSPPRRFGIRRPLKTKGPQATNASDDPAN